MSRSNAPLALSVVKVTEPGNVELTAARLREFDNMPFGFNHDYTWAVMPKARRGVFTPAQVAPSLLAKHARVRKCVTSLIELGCRDPRDARAFADFPEAGIRTVTEMQWGPTVTVRAKATCWYVDDSGRPIISLLQPRKEALELERLSVYASLSRLAFCKGEWVKAGFEIVDLSGEDDPSITARVIREDELPKVTEEMISSFVRTYMQAKELESTWPKKPRVQKRDERGPDLFGSQPDA